MVLKSLKGIYLFVEDVERSSRWYSQIFNLPITDKTPGRFALLNVNGYELCFHKADSKSPLSTGGSVGYWKVDNLGKATDFFVQHGGQVYRGPIQILGGQGICQIKDPFGNIVGLQGSYTAKH